MDFRLRFRLFTSILTLCVARTGITEIDVRYNNGQYKNGASLPFSRIHLLIDVPCSERPHNTHHVQLDLDQREQACVFIVLLLPIVFRRLELASSLFCARF